MNPPLYNDILFLIFDQVFISFKKEISIEFRKEMEKIIEEFNRKGTSAATKKYFLFILYTMYKIFFVLNIISN